MKCPNCGYEMSDEHLYCEKCGNEIQIVPDFEPELENSITETLSTVGEEIEGRVDTEKPFTSPKSSGHSSKTTSGKNSMVASLVIFVIVVLLTIFSGVFLYQRYSVNYQISRAGKYAERGKYAEAASYLERALKLEPGQTNVVLALANDYYLCGEKQKALAKAIDEINRKNGHNSIRVAVQGYDKKWHLKNEYVSKQYTTNINDIIVVKAK